MIAHPKSPSQIAINKLSPSLTYNSGALACKHDRFFATILLALCAFALICALSIPYADGASVNNLGKYRSNRGKYF